MSSLRWILALGAVAMMGVSSMSLAADHPARGPLAMERLSYPESRTVDVVDTYHGVEVADPYRWLEDVDSAETAAWVTAQNVVTEAFLNEIPERESYRARLTELWNYERVTTPERHGGRLFYTRNDGLQPQAVLYVEDAPGAAARVLLDPNTLSEDGTVALGGWSVSRDGRWLAWSTSDGGSDWQTWRVRDVVTGEDLADEVRWSKFSGAAWDGRGDGFYYSRYDAPAAGAELTGSNRFHKLYYHRRGTPQNEDGLIYERPDREDWGFDAHVTDDDRFLVINVWQGSSPKNGIFYKDLRDRSLVVRELLTGFDAAYTFLGNDGPVFYFQTDREAPLGKVVAIDIRQPSPDAWRTVVPEGADAIESVAMLGGGFVVSTLHDVASQVRQYDRAGQLVREIALPGLGAVSGFTGRTDDGQTWFTFESYLSADEIHHLDLASGATTLWRAPAIAFDFGAYETTRTFYHSQDGTRVPLFIVHRQGIALDGSNPTILYGYGGFNASITPRFRVSTLPWLEQGGVYAVANIRGGAEYGEAWHEAGCLANKQNVFDDFIAAAEHLIAEGWTSPARLAVSGASNGGLLVGAVVNQRPDLFGAALPDVGVMDMLRFQKFTIGWAWTSDYGSSEDAAMFPLLHGYSPYHNLKPGVTYPAVMVTTADHDDRVVPGHSFKYAARLQACQAGDRPALIRVQTRAGHGAGMPTAMQIAEYADAFAFLHRVLGM